MSDEQNRETEQNLKEIEREIREGAETMLSAAEEIAEKAEQSAEAAAPEEAPAEAEAPMEEGASAAQEENLREAEEAAGETVAEVLEEAGRLEDLTREEMESVYPDQQPPADFAADTHIDPEGPAPQPQQFQQPQQPAYGWQGTPQAAPVWQAAPVQGYYAPYPQKKKMSAGLKAFIIIASAMAVLAIGGFTGYLLANRGAPANPMEIIQNYDRDELPFDLPFDLPDGGEEDDEKPFSRPDRDGRDPSGGAEEEPGGENPGREDATPDFGATHPDASEPLPEIEMNPDYSGITVQAFPGGEELSAQEVYERVVKSTVTVAVTRSVSGTEQTSTGTGIIASSDGYIITNSHVVLNSKSSRVKITTYDGQEYDAVVVGTDRSTDLAVLKTNDYSFTPAEFGDSEELVIGDSVIAIGNPGGAKFSGSMTGGYISGLNREVGSYSANGMTYIQTDAAINPGNSGGPLVNMYGQVVGINSSKIVSSGYEGMGFAIPISKAQGILNELIAGGYVQGRVRLGISGQDVSNTTLAYMGAPQGFLIVSIDEVSAFSGTEAEEGDIITAVDGEVVTGLSDLSNLLLNYSPGQTASITLYRMNQSGTGSSINVRITLLEDRGETQK